MKVSSNKDIVFIINIDSVIWTGCKGFCSIGDRVIVGHKVGDGQLLGQSLLSRHDLEACVVLEQCVSVDTGNINASNISLDIEASDDIDVVGHGSGTVNGVGASEGLGNVLKSHVLAKHSRGKGTISFGCRVYSQSVNISSSFELDFGFDILISSGFETIVLKILPFELLGPGVQGRIILSSFEDALATLQLAEVTGAVIAQAAVVDTELAGGDLPRVGRIQLRGRTEGGGPGEVDRLFKHS